MGRAARLAIGAVAAAAAAERIGTPRLGAAIALTIAGLLIAGEFRRGQRIRGGWPIAIGAGLIALRLAVAPISSAPTGNPLSEQDAWSLVVLATGSPRDGHQTATLGTRPGETPAFSVAATLPRYPTITVGDLVGVDGQVRPRPDSDYGAYLERIGAAGTLSSRTLAIEGSPADLARRLEEVRRGVAEALAQVLPEPEAGLAAGILIGLRDRVDRELAAAFTAAGVSHVVAISGWNIAIVAAAIAAVAGRLSRRRRSVVSVAAIALYVAFAGAPASVVRAAIMAGVVLLARETGRAGRAAAALGWAATLLLLSDPALIRDVGFQLSSLATAGLIAWASPLTDWLTRVTRGRLPGWLAESLGVSLAAQAATLPIVLVSFGRLAILSPLVNLVVVPLVAPAMAAGLVALAGGLAVSGGLPGVLGAVLASPGWVILRLLVGVVQAAASLPFANVTLEPPFDSAAAMASVLAIGAVVLWRRSGRVRQGETEPPMQVAPGSAAQHVPRPSVARQAVLTALVISIVVAGGVGASRPAGIAQVTVLDVGQGDAILIEGSRGGRLLVDGGPDPDRLLIALDRRIPAWDRRIDVVVLSHPHEDHVAGLALLLQRYRVVTVLEPGMLGPGPGYAAWIRELADPNGPAHRSIAAGDRLAVDEIGLRVLWPKRNEVPLRPPDGGTGINNISVVLDGTVGDHRFLLMGDVEEQIDPTLLAQGLPHIDFLKVAHHGSRTATTQAFVDAVRPRIAVASAGVGNPYGHPARATLERLAASGARVLSTDRDGTVVVRFAATGVSVSSEGPRDTRPKPTAPRTSMTFRCSVPVTALVPEREQTQPSTGRSIDVEYHRADVRPRAGGGRLPPALPGPPALAGPAFARRRRGRRVAGGADSGARYPGQSKPGRGRRAAARRRQGIASQRSSPRAPPWRWLGRLAAAQWPSRAGTRRREPSCHPPGRR